MCRLVIPEESLAGKVYRTRRSRIGYGGHGQKLFKVHSSTPYLVPPQTRCKQTYTVTMCEFREYFNLTLKLSPCTTFDIELSNPQSNISFVWVEIDVLIARESDRGLINPT